MTLVETVYSSLDDGMSGDATRFVFDDPEAAASFGDVCARGSALVIGSDFGSDDGSDVGSATTDDGSADEAGSGLLDGSADDGSGSAVDAFGSAEDGSGSGLLDGSADDGSGSLAGSAALPISCNNGNFLHSAVNFLGLHPNPTHDVPLTTKTTSISFCSFNILQWIL